MNYSWDRNYEQSSSRLGDYARRKLKRTFDLMDVDVAVMARTTKILRIIEEKRWGQELKPSQQRLLPFLAMAIGFLKMFGLIHEQSGVFVVEVLEEERNKPLEIGFKHRVFNLTPTASLPPGYQLTPVQVLDINAFISCQPIGGAT